MIKLRKSGSGSILFLIGLGFQTQIHFFGSIGISELILFLVAPIVFVQDYHRLRYDGFLPMVWLSLLVCVGCVVSGLYNQAYYILILKRLATVYSMFVMLVVMHRLLRKDLSGLKYLLIGNFISSIICVFIFQQETSVVAEGDVKTGAEAIEAVTGYALFWTAKIANILELPVSCFYMQMPTAYSVLSPLVASGLYLIFSNSSGRSAAVVSSGAALIIFLGKKSARRIRRIGKNFILFVIVMGLLLVGMKAVYSHAAKAGLLGEAALKKYESQTRMGSSILRILMAGRVEFFVCMRAALDRPLLGWGPRPLDTGGYHADYLFKYGAPEDYDAYQSRLGSLAMKGVYGIPLPQHSVIASAWLTSGIIGLIFWLGVLWKMFSYFRHYAYAIPQYFGYVTILICHAGWNIFFSGQDRLGLPMMLVCILFARAVGKGRVSLTMEMAREVKQYNV